MKSPVRWHTPVIPQGHSGCVEFEVSVDCETLPQKQNNNNNKKPNKQSEVEEYYMVSRILLF